MTIRICEPIQWHFLCRLTIYYIRNDLPIVNEDYSPPSSSSGKHAVVSTLYTDSYAFAVAVLGHSTRHTNSSARLLLPYLKDRISPRALCIASAVGWEPHAVPLIPAPHNGQDIYYRFADQYTKLNIWSFDELGVERLVYLDADTLVRRNFDELFDNPFNFAAVPDVYGNSKGFSITFNAGVLALRPSTKVFQDMKRKIESAMYPLGEAEQAFWIFYLSGKSVRLRYAYNANLAIKRRSPALWDGLKEEMRIVHYTTVKPFVYIPDSPDLMAIDELGEAMKLAGSRDGGFYADEVRWWKEAYERMMQDRGDAITSCYHR